MTLLPISELIEQLQEILVYVSSRDQIEIFNDDVYLDISELPAALVHELVHDVLMGNILLGEALPELLEPLCWQAVSKVFEKLLAARQQLHVRLRSINDFKKGFLLQPFIEVLFVLVGVPFVLQILDVVFQAFQPLNFPFEGFGS